MVDVEILRRRLDTLAGYLDRVDRFRDAFAVLQRHGLLDETLSQRLQSWAGFRNVLVHAYLAIDHGMAWDAIQQDLGDLRAFAAVAARKL